MAVDMFMKVDGIPGESTDDAHADWSELLDFSIGVSNDISMSSGTKGQAEGGRASFQDMTVTKVADMASPDLMIQCAGCDPISKVEIEVCQASGDKKLLAKYTLEKCAISSYQTGGASGGETRPVETVGIAYGKIKTEYASATDDKVDRTWNLETNVKE